MRAVATRSHMRPAPVRAAARSEPPAPTRRQGQDTDRAVPLKASVPSRTPPTAPGGPVSQARRASSSPSAPRAPASPRLVDASVALPSPTGEPAPPSPFSWTRQWYPLAVAADLDVRKPHAITLLGTPLALFHDGGAWRALADDCPHRRAPLSQGRVQAEEGGRPASLVCSYHGWRFGGDGRPVCIPQATHDGGAVEKAALASPRACVKSFPTRLEDGLLWVWADGPGTAALADATPTPGNAAARSLDPSAITATTNQWFVRDFPIPHDELVGNLLSQDHVPFAHSGVASSRHSPYAAHFEVSRMNAARDAAGVPDGLTFDLEWAPDARKLVKQRVACVPPAYIEYVTPAAADEEEEGGGEGDKLLNVLFFYATPLDEGRTRVINHALITQPMPAWASRLLASRPRWVDHLLLNEVFDGDMAFLATTATNTKTADPSGASWARECYLPTGADGPFRAWQRWLHGRGGGGWVAAVRGAPPSAPPASGSLPRRTVLDRYESHTAHCPSCSAALAGLQRWGLAVRVGAGAAFLAAAVAAGGAAADGGGLVESVGAALAPTAVCGAALALSAGLKAAEARFAFKVRLRVFSLQAAGGGGGGWAASPSFPSTHTPSPSLFTATASHRNTSTGSLE
jgi:pheophorbide a oxygenase